MFLTLSIKQAIKLHGAPPPSTRFLKPRLKRFTKNDPFYRNTVYVIEVKTRKKNRGLRCRKFG
jgi:hypothetical protein